MPMAQPMFPAPSWSEPARGETKPSRKKQGFLAMTRKTRVNCRQAFEMGKGAQYN